MRKIEQEHSGAVNGGVLLGNDMLGKKPTCQNK